MAQDRRGQGPGNRVDIKDAAENAGANGGTKYYQSFMRSMSSAVPSWHEEAACSTYDWYLFELIDYDNSIAAGLSFAQLWSFNQRNHELGRSICETCPVKATCLKEAGHEDTRWTMRGGEGPRATIGQTGDRRVPRCTHRKNVILKSGSMSVENRPACDECAKSADVIVLTRLANTRHAT